MIRVPDSTDDRARVLGIDDQSRFPVWGQFEFVAVSKTSIKDDFTSAEFTLFLPTDASAPVGATVSPSDGLQQRFCLGLASKVSQAVGTKGLICLRGADVIEDHLSIWSLDDP